MARIAVIGAGMGAMTAAARLAVAGHRVTVFERADTFGGALGGVERDGFVFDTGPGLLHLPAVYRDLFVKTGKESLEESVELTQVEPAVRHVFADGTEVRLANASRAAATAALDRALGAGAGARWGAFMNRAREAWDRSRRPLLEEPLWPNWQVLADREPYPALRHRRLLRRARAAATLAEIAEWELGGDPRLRAVLEHHALDVGLDPRTAPASAAVLPYLTQTFGTWAVRGGLRELARAVYERCRARRVEFRFGAAVTRIVEKDGAAAGVELADGSVHEARFVVAGVAPSVLDELLPGPGTHAPDPAQTTSGTSATFAATSASQATSAASPHARAFAAGPEPMDGGGGPGGSGLPSRLTVLLALRGARPDGAAHRTVVHTADRRDELDRLFGSPAALPASPTLTVLRPADPAVVPDAGHEAVTVTLAAPAGMAGGRATDEAVERVLVRAERAVDQLRDRLLWHEVRTPADVAAATGAPGGAIPPPALAAAGGRLLHPSNSTRVPGLFTVGGWSHPGGGLPHAGMSGALVAGLIVEGPQFRGSQ